MRWVEKEGARRVGGWEEEGGGEDGRMRIMDQSMVHFPSFLHSHPTPLIHEHL